MNATSPIAVPRALPESGQRVPGFDDPDVRWIFAATFLLQAFAWWWLEGYPLADAVGYLDRSSEFVTSGGLTPTAENLRSVAFPLLFAPLFWIAETFELEDNRWIMPCARLMQMAMAAGLVHGCIRLGAQLYGRSAGLAAGLLATTSPVLVVHSVSPVADVAAGLCVVHATEALMFGANRKRLAMGGLWAGLGFVISYKTLAVQLLLGLLLLIRDRWRRRGAWGALALGVSAFCMVQIVADKFVYGRAGHSVGNYLADNVLGVFARALLGVGLLEPGKAIYRWMSELREYQLDEAVHWDLVTPSNQMGAFWYLDHAHEVLVPVIAVLLPFGFYRIVREPRLRRLDAWIPVLVVVGYVYLLSQKGNKSMRLLLPVLPFLVVTAAAGWPGLRGWFAARVGERATFYLARAGIALALGTAVFGYHLSQPRAYGGYWQAMEWINARAAELDPQADPDEEPQRVASAHYFAVFLRAAPGVQQVRYRYPVWEWRAGADEGEYVASQINVHIGRTLDESDWLVHAEALMARRPTYLRALQSRYDVAAAFWDGGFHSERVGPIYVLQRRRDGPDSGTGRQFFAVSYNVDIETYRAQRGLGEPIVFARTDAAGKRRELALLGVEAEPLPGSGMTWLTFHWTTPTGLDEDWNYDTHLVTQDGRAFDLGHRPAYDVLPTSGWRPRWVIREGLLARTEGPALVAYPSGTHERPKYRMTMDLVTRDESGEPVLHLLPDGRSAGPVEVADFVAE